jgi:hypothetical protein
MSAEKTIGTTLIKTKSGSEGEDLTIGNLTSIGEIGLESGEVEVTTLDSEDGFREFMPGFKDAGEVPIAGIIKSETAMVAMYALSDSQSIEEFTIESPEGNTWVFEAFVKSFKEGEVVIDGVRNFTGALRITGKPVYTSAGASA